MVGDNSFLEPAVEDDLCQIQASYLELLNCYIPIYFENS